MANAKITALTSLTTPSADDVIPIVDDPSGSPVTKKITVQNLLAGGLAQGTSFPVSPTTNDRFFRTDRSIEYFYNGTRWLSLQLHVLPLATSDANFPLNATLASVQRVIAPFPAVTDLWLEQFQMSFYIVGGTALSASHKWVITFSKATGAPSLSTLATVTIDSGASSTWRSSTQTINALLGTSYLEVETAITKTGTPGNIYMPAALTFRMVG